MKRKSNKKYTNKKLNQNPKPKNPLANKIETDNFFHNHKEKIILFVLLFFFVMLGSSGLGKFFTTDETAWFYAWVEQYKNAYLSGDFAKTNFASYPGVLHSFLCGIVNLFLDPKACMSHDKIETYLFWWRFPILLFNAISLFGIYFLLKKFFSQTQSFLIVFLTAFTPIIFGMSRIVNSDSLLWSTSLISILSYIIFVRNRENKYMIISGIFMGMALASKYNAILLFIYQPLTLISEFLFNKISKQNFKKIVFKTFVIWVISLLVFSMFLPAVFVEPNLYRGRVFGYFITNPIFIFIISFIIFDTYFFKNKILFYLKENINLKKYLIKILPVLFLFIITLSLFVHYFDLKPDAWNMPNKQWKIPFVKAIFLNFRSFFFSQQIATVCGLVLFVIISLLRKNKKQDFSIPLLMLSFIFIFILGAVTKGVDASGHRYIIMLYPYIVIVTVWSFSFFENKKIIFLLIAFLSIIDISLTYPKFYIFYQNNKYFEGQKSYMWAIGGYDLAQKLNKLPNANQMKVYADRYSFKHFFKGYTENIITNTKESKIKEFDYLCLSKAGYSQVPMSPTLENYYKISPDSFDYFIGNKKTAWLGIIKVDKTKKELKIPNTFDPEFYLNNAKNWTIAFWEKHRNNNPENIIYIGENYKTGIEFKINENNFIAKYGENEIFKSDTLQKNKFNNIILQHTTNENKKQNFTIWINGKKIISENVKNKKLSKTKFFIAIDFKGVANDMRIYNKKLSEEQINVIYNGGKMTLEQELICKGEKFSPAQHFTQKTAPKN